MANRVQERASPPRPLQHSLSSAKTFGKSTTSQDVFRHFMKNIDYEYLRKEFNAVKEKLKVGNRNAVLANPTSNISMQKPPGMVKISKKVPPIPPSPGRGLRTFVAKTLISAAAIYASVHLGVWGTAEDTSGLAAKIVSAFHKEGKSIDPKAELTTRYNQAVIFVAQELGNLPTTISRAYTIAASFLQSKMKRD